MFSFRRKKYHSYSDEQLVNAYKMEWDKFYISLLYERYSHLVMGTALNYLKNRTEAEDITMNVFESLFEKLKVHDVVNFKSWLYMVTRNECLMFLRKVKRAVPIELESISEETESDLEHKEIQLDLLASQIETLKSEQRKCIELFYLEQQSYQEISDALSISIKQVKSAIQNGKRNLKILLEKENEFNQ